MEKPDTFSPSDYPRVKELSKQLFLKLLDESSRGAIIIGASYVEDELEAFLKNVCPNVSNKYQKKIFGHLGMLGSFGAKIEMAYFFRLINKNVYDSLNLLRKIRNEAAHTKDEFAFDTMRERISKIFDLGPTMSKHIRHQAIKSLFEYKREIAENILEESGIPPEDRDQKIYDILSDEKTSSALERQVPHWELIIGLTFICGYISFIEEKTIKKLTEQKTWAF